MGIADHQDRARGRPVPGTLIPFSRSRLQLAHGASSQRSTSPIGSKLAETKRSNERNSSGGRGLGLSAHFTADPCCPRSIAVRHVRGRSTTGSTALRRVTAARYSESTYRPVQSLASHTNRMSGDRARCALWGGNPGYFLRFLLRSVVVRSGGVIVDVDGATKLLDATARLLGAIIWPATIFYMLIRFGPSIGSFISSLGEINLKGAGFEASARRRQNEAAGALAAATVSRPEEGATTEAAANAAKEAVQVVGGVSSKVIRQIEGVKVLWVDDNPDNNNYERQALEALGVQFMISTSTEDAINKVKNHKFGAIISDMGRRHDPRAGYTLLEKLRASGDRTPFIIYSRSRSPENQAEARRRGAVGCTNRATELFEMVLSALMH